MRQQRVAIGKRILFSLFREVQKVFYIKTFFVASGRIRLRSFIEHLFDSPCPYKLSLALCAVTNFAPTRILYFLFYRPTPLTFIKLILIKESISLNAFIKKTFTISDLASLAAPSYVVRLPLYNHPFRGWQASEVHRSLENLLGRLFLTYGDCALHCLFITGIYLSIISGITLKLPLLPKWSILNGCRVIAFNGLGLSYDSEWP